MKRLSFLLEKEFLQILGYWDNYLEGKVNKRYYIEEIIGRKLRTLESYDRSVL